MHRIALLLLLLLPFAACDARSPTAPNSAEFTAVLVGSVSSEAPATIAVSDGCSSVTDAAGRSVQVTAIRWTYTSTSTTIGGQSFTTDVCGQDIEGGVPAGDYIVEQSAVLQDNTTVGPRVYPVITVAPAT